MSKNDIRSFFSQPSDRPETNSSSTASTSLKPAAKKRQLAVNSVTAARHKRLKKRATDLVDDVDDEIHSVKSIELQRPDSGLHDDDDDVILLVGSLADDAANLRSNQTSRSDPLLLSNSSQVDKRNTTNQLFSDPISLPRRSGSAAADRRMPTERSTTSQWTKVREMCRAMDIDGNFTGVDVGRINLGIIQISCLGEKIKILDWKLINLDTLCSEFESANPQEIFSEKSGKYGNADHCHCLFKYVEQKATRGGIFDSSVVFIEQQAFTREMKAIQNTIHMAVISKKPSIMVCLNNPDFGPSGMRAANFVSSVQLVSANSVKTCYAAFYPRVTETAATIQSRNPYQKKKAFGHADANRGGTGDEDIDNKKQYDENKRNSAKYGQMIITVDEIIRLLHGTKMDDAQMSRFKKEKKDDIYDAMWLVLYGLETWLPAVYASRKRGFAAKSLMYAAQNQRRYRMCDALFEFAESVGTSTENIEVLRGVLSRFKGTEESDSEE